MANKFQKKLTIIFLFFFTCGYAQLILEYNILNPNTEIGLPFRGIVNVTIDWGDGTNQETVIEEETKIHNYLTPGIKTVVINGSLTTFGNPFIPPPSPDRLIRVLNWEGLGIQMFNYAFENCTNLIDVPSSLPSTVINTSGMFFYATNFNDDISNWDVSNLGDMYSMFQLATSFNQPIGNWNMSNVTSLRQMFVFATSFNQPIGNWNVANVNDMSDMFSHAVNFNQPLGNWNVAKVTSMVGMFSNASSFNQPIGNWNVANVTNMARMFEKDGTTGSGFNQPLNEWNTSKVVNTAKMFGGATSFEQNIGNWNVTNISNMFLMFDNVKLCTENYDAILNGWAVQNVKPNVNFSGGLSNYSVNSAAARNLLINNKNWAVIDYGADISGNGFCNLSNNNFEKLNFTIFPNPVKSELNIIMDDQYEEVISYEIFNAIGQKIDKNNIGLDNKINCESFNNGIYLLKLFTNNSSMSKLFIKNKN